MRSALQWPRISNKPAPLSAGWRLAKAAGYAMLLPDCSGKKPESCRRYYRWFTWNATNSVHTHLRRLLCGLCTRCRAGLQGPLPQGSLSNTKTIPGTSIQHNPQKWEQKDGPIPGLSTIPGRVSSFNGAGFQYVPSAHPYEELCIARFAPGIARCFR